MNTVNKPFLLVILIAVSHFGFTQVYDNSIYTYLDETNLKGSPKEIVARYERFYYLDNIDKGNLIDIIPTDVKKIELESTYAAITSSIQSLSEDETADIRDTLIRIQNIIAS